MDGTAFRLSLADAQVEPLANRTDRARHMGSGQSGRRFGKHNVLLRAMSMAFAWFRATRWD
jgi:hypothetical protein